MRVLKRLFRLQRQQISVQSEHLTSSTATFCILHALGGGQRVQQQHSIALQCLKCCAALEFISVQSQTKGQDSLCSPNYSIQAYAAEAWAVLHHLQLMKKLCSHKPQCHSLLQASDADRSVDLYVRPSCKLRGSASHLIHDQQMDGRALTSRHICQPICLPVLV